LKNFLCEFYGSETSVPFEVHLHTSSSQPVRKLQGALLTSWRHVIGQWWWLCTFSLLQRIW